MIKNKLRKVIRKIILEDSSSATVPFNDEIKNEMRKIYAGSDFEKTGILEQRIEQLLNIHAKWLELAKQHYNAHQV